MNNTNTVLSATEERIIEGARELFFRNGMKSITMDDIASHLGISKKTIYQFHKDKDALIYELTALELQKQELEMHAIRKQSKDPVEEILLAMASMSKMMIAISPAVFYDLQKYYRKSWKRFQEFKNKQIVNYVEENMRSGIRMGLYRANIPIKILARLRLEEIELGYNPEVYPPSHFNITEVQVALMDHFLHGIVTIKGHRLINKYKQIQEEE
jgi:AcrR family transcriptional regulator